MEIQDRFRFRVWNNRDWDKDFGKVYYDAEETYDYIGGNPSIPANSFDVLLNEDEWIIEQCIGLKDKNSKLIYYNDYVNYKGNIYKVFWNKTKISLENILNNDIIDIIDVEEFNSMEIIGNEHENKELLND